MAPSLGRQFQKKKKKQMEWHNKQLLVCTFCVYCLVILYTCCVKTSGNNGKKNNNNHSQVRWIKWGYFCKVYYPALFSLHFPPSQIERIKKCALGGKIFLSIFYLSCFLFWINSKKYYFSPYLSSSLFSSQLIIP